MSIQLSLNGLSFCISRYGTPLWLAHERIEPGEDMFRTFSRAKESHEELRRLYRRLRALVDTDRVCLIPSEYEREDVMPDFLQVNEIPFSEEKDQLLQAREHEGVIGLICLPLETTQVLKHHFPETEIAYTHPLLLAMRRSGRGPVIDICLSQDGFGHIMVVPKEKPVYAATVPCKGSEDLLFILNTLGGRFPLSDYVLLFSGADASAMRKEIGRFFRHTALDMPFAPSREMRHLDIPSFANVIRAAYENY